jgi:NAD(P)-dependent dehydrogenase (short-subunit alcohol dehydrogenase family)
MASSTPVALVTGGARGIGLGVSRRLAAEGWSLAICGTRAEAAVGEPLDELRRQAPAVLYVRASVADREDRARLVEAIRERFGRLDALVNNAGIAPRVRADILEATEESFEEVIGTNLQGPYFLTQAVARWMIEQRSAESSYRGCIVNISSISATVASVNRGDYCISKAGISMATRLWAVRLAEHGIPVYEVRPGVIATDMTAGVRERYDRLIEGGLLLQARWGQPEDVGRAVAALLRGDLPYSTGQVVMVDGGLTVDRL